LADEEEKNEVKARLHNDDSFAEAFLEDLTALFGEEIGEDIGEEAGEETKETREPEDDETKEDAGDKAKEDTGEEAKEDAESFDPFIKRTASMDDEERKQALKSILGNYTDRDSLVDDMGLPLGKEQLWALAKLAPIWGALTDQQKQLFHEE
jgi:hypothetical protein